MFDIGSSELLLIIVVAVVVIGPKDLPRVLYKLGQYVAKGRAMTRHFRSGIDEMIRQAEMEEMEKKWAEQNARIMAQTAEGHETQPPVALPDAAPDATEPKSEVFSPFANDPGPPPPVSDPEPAPTPETAPHKGGSTA